MKIILVILKLFEVQIESILREISLVVISHDLENKKFTRGGYLEHLIRRDKICAKHGLYYQENEILYFRNLMSCVITIKTSLSAGFYCYLLS